MQLAGWVVTRNTHLKNSSDEMSVFIAHSLRCVGTHVTASRVSMFLYSTLYVFFRRWPLGAALRPVRVGQFVHGTL